MLPEIAREIDQQFLIRVVMSWLEERMEQFQKDNAVRGRFSHRSDGCCWEVLRLVETDFHAETARLSVSQCQEGGQAVTVVHDPRFSLLQLICIKCCLRQRQGRVPCGLHQPADEGSARWNIIFVFAPLQGRHCLMSIRNTYFFHPACKPCTKSSTLYLMIEGVSYTIAFLH